MGAFVAIRFKTWEFQMDVKTETLAPAGELARDNRVRILNESAEYRAARTALLAEEIELRRHIERVAAQRRALPPGGAVIGEYRFQGEDGADRFRRPIRRQVDARRLQLHVRPSAGSPLPHVHQYARRLGGKCRRHRPAHFAGGGRPLADRRLVAWKRERGWKNLRAL